MKRRKKPASHRPRTSLRRRILGQHFLASGEVRDRIFRTLGALKDSHVLEIGAGRGELTQELAQRAGRLTALEIDSRLAGNLEQAFKEMPHVSILGKDALRFDYTGWAQSCAPLKPLVVGNIPYRITNSLLHALIGSHSRLESVVLMLQEEVARKLSAPAGHKPYGMLSVLAGYHSKVEYLFQVGRENFSPCPNVDSALVRLDFKQPCQCRAEDEAFFQALVRRLFLERRKQIQRILRNDQRFTVSAEDIDRLEKDTGLKLSCRPEELTIEQLVALADGLSSVKVKT